MNQLFKSLNLKRKLLFNDRIGIFMPDIYHLYRNFLLSGFVEPSESIAALRDVEVVVETIAIMFYFFSQLVPHFPLHFY